MDADVVVVGGGAIGVCCAHELAQRGIGVTLLESGEELAAGASSGNAGLLCPSHSAPIANPASVRNGLRWMLTPESPFYLRPRPASRPGSHGSSGPPRPARAAEGTRIIRELSVASLELHAELADAGLQTGFERRGILNVYETTPAFALAQAHAEGTGLDARVLGPEETRLLEPAVGERIAGGVYFPDEAHCDPLAFVYAVARAAREAGATIQTHVRGQAGCAARTAGSPSRRATARSTPGRSYWPPAPGRPRSRPRSASSSRRRAARATTSTSPPLRRTTRRSRSPSTRRT